MAYAIKKLEFEKYIVLLVVERRKCMPRRDGTGPNGMGAMTGRGLGECNKENSESSFGNRNFCQKGRGRKSENCLKNGRGFGCKRDK